MNKLKIRDYTNNALYIMLAIMVLWVVISSEIQAFKCPGMTQTQLFLHIPRSFICNWKHCY